MTNSWVCYCVDRGVMAFGNYVESKLSQRDKRGKPRYKLAQLLAEPPKPGERKVVTVSQMMALGLPVQLPKPD